MQSVCQIIQFPLSISCNDLYSMWLVWHSLISNLTDYSKEVNYLYAIPLKEFYNDTIKVAAKAFISRYQVPHSKGTTLFCTSPLHDQFLRLAVAVKSRVYMLAYKHPASKLLEGSPLTPLSSTDPKENFIKHQVSYFSMSFYCDCV